MKNQCTCLEAGEMEQEIDFSCFLVENCFHIIYSDHVLLIFVKFKKLKHDLDDKTKVISKDNGKIKIVTWYMLTSLLLKLNLYKLQTRFSNWEAAGAPGVRGHG